MLPTAEVPSSRYLPTCQGVNITCIPPRHAPQDTALPISCGQTMPAFSVHAKFLALLEPCVQPGARVLDLGSGELFLKL